MTKMTERTDGISATPPVSQTAEEFGYPDVQKRAQETLKDAGDIVKDVVTIGKKVGTYFGWVAVRKTGSFNIKTREGTVQGISHRYCKLLQRADGYGYAV